MKKLNLNVKTICLMAMFFVAWPACASSPAWPSNPAWPSDPAWPSAPSCLAKAKAKVKTQTRTYDSKAVEKMTERFVAYAKINSQGTDTSDMSVFPINAGQREMAQKEEADLQAAVRGTSATVRRSESEYVYVKIPANAKGIPSIMFMAHLDITPEAPGGNITPVVHRAYDGGDLVLSVNPAGQTSCPVCWQDHRHLRRHNAPWCRRQDGMCHPRDPCGACGPRQEHASW